MGNWIGTEEEGSDDTPDDVDDAFEIIDSASIDGPPQPNNDEEAPPRRSLRQTKPHDMQSAVKYLEHVLKGRPPGTSKDITIIAPTESVTTTWLDEAAVVETTWYNLSITHSPNSGWGDYRITITATVAET